MLSWGLLRTASLLLGAAAAAAASDAGERGLRDSVGGGKGKGAARRRPSDRDGGLGFKYDNGGYYQDDKDGRNGLDKECKAAKRAAKKCAKFDDSNSSGDRWSGDDWHGDGHRNGGKRIECRWAERIACCSQPGGRPHDRKARVCDELGCDLEDCGRRGDSSGGSLTKRPGLPPPTRYRWNALADFGDPCEEGDDCQSGICGTSCSSYDANPTTSTSCVCPCTDNVTKVGGIGDFLPGPCCCGCLRNGGTATEDGEPVAEVCPQHTVLTRSNPSGLGWARKNAQEEPPLDSIPCDFTYARFNRLNIANDDIVIPKGVEYKVDWFGPSPNGTKNWGEPCDDAGECISGMCGTGCDCPSEAYATCSCDAPCNFPAKCCGGGCSLDRNPVAQICPVLDYERLGRENGVDFDDVECDGDNCVFDKRITYTTFDGPTPWLPDEAHKGEPSDVTYALCLIYKHTMEGVDVPTVCNGLLSRPPTKLTGLTADDVDAALCRTPNY